MESISKDQVETIAYEIKGWIESACGDAAYSGFDCLIREYPEKKKRWEKERIPVDLQKDILADLLFNDPDYLGDFLGDRIFDAANPFGGSNEVKALIAREISSNSHKAMRDACAKLLIRWNIA